jgi:hypothetical protein
LQKWFLRVPRSAVLAAPYLLIAAYYGLVFVGRGLHGGDLDECVTPRSEFRDAGACPHFAGPLHDRPWDAAVLRYRVWSSRFTVELVEYSLSHTLWLFVVITIALAWLFLWSARSLLEIESARGLLWFALLFCLLVPPQFHRNAGVYSTIIFGSWTSFLGIFSIAVVVRRIRRARRSPWLEVATIPALAFALCSEQFVAAFGLAVGAIVYQVLSQHRTDLRAQLALYATLWVASVTNILLCPGNAARQAREIDYWMPRFPAMSMPEKLANGTHHALWLLVRPESTTITLVGLLIGILIAAARITDTSYAPGAGVAIWLAALICSHAAGADLSRQAWTTIVAGAFLALPAIFGAANVTAGDRRARTPITLFLTGGFGSAMLMSFSPTLWASDTRTLLLEYLSLVAALFLLAQSAWRQATSARKRQYFKVMSHSPSPL